MVDIEEVPNHKNNISSDLLLSWLISRKFHIIRTIFHQTYSEKVVFIITYHPLLLISEVIKYQIKISLHFLLYIHSVDEMSLHWCRDHWIMTFSFFGRFPSVFRTMGHCMGIVPSSPTPRIICTEGLFSWRTGDGFTYLGQTYSLRTGHLTTPSLSLVTWLE